MTGAAHSREEIRSAITGRATPGPSAWAATQAADLLTPAGLPAPPAGCFRGFYDNDRMGFTGELHRLGALPSQRGSVVIALFNADDEGAEASASMHGGCATISVHDYSQTSGRPAFALRLEVFDDALRTMRMYFSHVLDMLDQAGQDDEAVDLDELTRRLLALGLRDISSIPAA